MVNIPLGFDGLYIAATTTAPNNSTACSTMSTCPRCIGSKLPGYSTLGFCRLIGPYGNRSRVVTTVRP